MGPVLAGLGAATLRTAASALARRGGQALLAAAEQRMVAAVRSKIAAKVVTIGRNVVEEVEHGEGVSAEYALLLARYLSSGRLSSRQLALMGHPYRIGGNPPTDPAVIHRQSGAFYRGWRVRGPARKNGGISTTLENAAPHAPLLFGGTSRMIARPILQRIDEMTATKRRTNVAAAIRRALVRSR